jgi:hypothetical protein
MNLSLYVGVLFVLLREACVARKLQIPGVPFHLRAHMIRGN